MKYHKRYNRLAISLLAVCIAFLAGCSASGNPSSNSDINSGTVAFPDKYNNSFMQNAYTEDTRVYFSDGNGGWTDVTPSNIPAGEVIDCALFPDQNNGWVTSGVPGVSGLTVNRTTDGGKNWTASSVNIQGSISESCMDFVNANDGWMLVAQDAGAGSQSCSVLKTTNGGATWVIASVTVMGGGDGSTANCLPGGGDKIGVSFCDAENGYTAVQDASGIIILYATHDGGSTWQELNITAPNSDQNDWYNTYQPMFFSGGYGILPVSCSLSTASAGTMDITMYFYSTTDSGATWILMPSNVPNLTSTPLYCFSSDGQSGYLTDGTVLYTLTDGNWTQGIASASLSGEQMIYTGGNPGWIIPQ